MRFLERGKMQRKTKGGFRTKTEALLYLPILREQLEKGQVNAIGFSDLWDRWSGTKIFTEISQDKQRAYRIAYNKMTALHGLTDIRQASFDSMQGMIDGLTYYPARDVKRVLNGMFELAEKMGYLEKNLVPYLELPKLEKSVKTVFTEEQIAKIAECGDEFRKYILLMIYMGLRPVEMLGMTAEDVHLEEGYTDGGRKTELSSQICIFPEAVPILRDLCEEVKTGRLCPLSEDGFYTMFYRCLDSAGVQERSVHDLTPYSCRHTFVTRLTKMGMPQALIQKAARHTSYKTTQVYTHIDFSDVLKRYCAEVP